MFSPVSAHVRSPFFLALRDTPIEGRAEESRSLRQGGHCPTAAGDAVGVHRMIGRAPAGISGGTPTLHGNRADRSVVRRKCPETGRIRVSVAAPTRGFHPAGAPGGSPIGRARWGDRSAPGGCDRDVTAPPSGAWSRVSAGAGRLSRWRGRWCDRGRRGRRPRGGIHGYGGPGRYPALGSRERGGNGGVFGSPGRLGERQRMQLFVG